MKKKLLAGLFVLIPTVGLIGSFVNLWIHPEDWPVIATMAIVFSIILNDILRTLYRHYGWGVNEEEDAI